NPCVFNNFEVKIKIEKVASSSASSTAYSPAAQVIKTGSTYGTLPTPTRTGYTFDGWYTSATGGTKITSSATVTATGDQTLYAHWTCNHSYTSEIVTAATCNATGTKKFTCKTCGDTYTETIAIDPNNHTGGTEVKNAKSPICGEDGYTGDTCCKGCSAVLSKGEVIPATGTHSFGEWEQSKAPTCTAEGEEIRICTVCGIIENRTLDRLAHSYTSSVIEPTCEEDGAIIYECVCGDSYSEVIAATGHTDNDNDGICDDCAKDIKQNTDPSANCPCICHKTGFMGFIYKIVRVFWKLFRINKTCVCGVEHY
ncbi:MAG: InlB B-repeat-containing protein, partial [Acutalibacteraceae bacterium]